VNAVSEATDPSLRELIYAALAGLQARFGVAARVVGIGPGRVNIIGEHVDYAGGVVVPFAIDRWCAAAASSSRNGDAWRVVALDLDEVWEVPGDIDLRRAAISAGSWQSYVVGVLALAKEALAARGVVLEPMSIAITSNVPRGSGLSSSAALTVAVAKAVEGVVEGVVGAAIYDDGLEVARLCQRAEREFAGVPCGLMDHAASVLGRNGRAIVLECREPETIEYVRVPDGLAWLVVESGVLRSLAAGKYAALREASDEAARVLGVRWLYDAREEELDAFAQKLSVAARRAATHAIGERGRVERVLAACARGDAEGVKREMNAAHASLRDVLEVSCHELDVIVESAQGQGAGARLVGAGFGGCALVAVEAARAEEVATAIRKDFEAEFGRVCRVWRVTPSDGARGEVTK
jgi:galactokinase